MSELISAVTDQAVAGSEPVRELKPFGDDGLTFADLLDIINPLQHIPIISTLYRQFTGDTIDPAMRIAGGALFGGPIGAIVSVFNVMVKGASGKDFGEHAFAMVFDEAPENDPLLAGGDTVKPDIAWNQPARIENNDAQIAQITQIAWNGRRQVGGIPGGAEQNNGAGDTPGFDDKGPIAWNAPRHTPETNNDERIAWNAPRHAPETNNDERIAWNTPRHAPETNNDERIAWNTPRHAPETNNDERIAWNGPRRHPGPTPAGALASEGGWFSSTMLTALSRYQDGARLMAERPVHRVNVVN